ncbi:ribosome biosis protein wdr12-like protein [Dermatophagoides farinae]|uniref:Ribosome biogenesis protein WDR12 homolog n=1 Tax=Dermatophagoides farinae TaxID=6954 RepID=A0A9D4P6K3_DERFA|nr:ribosome biosis protein wdr12-like protein [Dermatophagoides farinae]
MHENSIITSMNGQTNGMENLTSKYAIPSIPINIKSSSTAKEFDNVIKALIKDGNKKINLKQVEFDFLINGKLLRQTIEEFIKNENISTEIQIEIEYFVKCEPPKPHKSFLHNDWVSSVDTIDEWILSGCYDSSAHIWNVKNGHHEIAIPAPHTSSIKAVKWIRNELEQKNQKYSFVTCSHDETAMLWNWDAKLNQVDHVFTYIGHCRSVDCVDQHKDLIATGSYDNMLKIWSTIDQIYDDDNDVEMKDISKKKLRSPAITLEGHKESISSCVWMNEQVPTVLTVSLDQTMKIWDIEVGEQKQSFSSSKSFLDVAYCPSTGHIITASCDRHIRVWDLRQNQGSLIKNVYSSHDAWVSSVDWSSINTNLFVSASYDSTAKQWDIRSPSAPLYDLLGHQDKIMSINWSNEHFIVSGGADSQIKIFSCLL